MRKIGNLLVQFDTASDGKWETVEESDGHYRRHYLCVDHATTREGFSYWLVIVWIWRLRFTGLSSGPGSCRSCGRKGDACDCDINNIIVRIQRTPGSKVLTRL